MFKRIIAATAAAAAAAAYGLEKTEPLIYVKYSTFWWSYDRVTFLSHLTPKTYYEYCKLVEELFWIGRDRMFKSSLTLYAVPIFRQKLVDKEFENIMCGEYYYTRSPHLTTTSIGKLYEKFVIELFEKNAGVIYDPKIIKFINNYFNSLECRQRKQLLQTLFDVLGDNAGYFVQNIDRFGVGSCSEGEILNIIVSGRFYSMNTDIIAKAEKTAGLHFRGVFTQIQT